MIKAIAAFVLASGIGLAFGPSYASAAGDPEHGRALAQVWCANCHTVERQGQDTAPPLEEIARHGSPEEREARAFLNAPHPPMPDFNLARQQIDDIVAYLQSLASTPSR